MVSCPRNEKPSRNHGSGCAHSTPAADKGPHLRPGRCAGDDDDDDDDDDDGGGGGDDDGDGGGKGGPS